MSRPGRFSLLAAGALGLAALCGGCAQGASAEAKKLDEMQLTLGQLRTDHDKLAERIASLEIARGSTAATDDARTPTNLRVIRLGPGLSPSGGDGERVESAAGETAGMSTDDADGDPTPRPVIQATGSSAGRGARRAKAGSDATTAALDPEAKRAYDAALAKVNKKDYPGALDAFTAFLVRWPDHPRADNAMYWRGECYFAQGDFAHAADEFSGVLARFPEGNKAPDALLKLGMSQQKLGRTAEAKDSFARLTREFPHAEAARKVPPMTSSTTSSPAAAGDIR